MLFVGTTISPTITDPSVICKVPSITRSKLTSDGTVHMNMCNLKRAGGFDGTFPFNGLIIL